MSARVKRMLGAVAASLMLLAGGAISASAAETPHVAKCAVEMGGQHVARCAQAMDKGVSACAQEQ